MRPLRYSPLVALAAVWLAPHCARADSNSVVISADGAKLTDASGGAGGSLTWLHDFTSGVLGVGGEYQRLADTHWAFGSLSGSVSTGSANDKWTFSADGHLGRGDTDTALGVHHFDYQVEGAGVSGTFDGKLTLQLEGRQYDIDTTHGSLPKAGLGVLWTPHWQTSVAYARSVGGNLGTELETLRIDHYGATVNWLLGGAAGHVAPRIVNIYTGATGPAPQLREGFVGLSKAFGRSDWSILGDYLKVAGEKRITLTVVCTLHGGSSAS
jgi:hypothetical protein